MSQHLKLVTPLVTADQAGQAALTQSIEELSSLSHAGKLASAVWFVYEANGDSRVHICKHLRLRDIAFAISVLQHTYDRLLSASMTQPVDGD